MTAYNLHTPGVTSGLEITKSPEAIAARAKRQHFLEEIRRRRRERYKHFLARFQPQKQSVT